MACRFARHLALSGAAVFRLLAQQPTVEPNGIRNAASLLPVDAVALQMIVAIRGQNLASSTDAANSSPLPISLGGATVTFNGTPAPLLFASPEQINAQVPSALRGSTTAEIVVTTVAGSSEPVRATVTARAFGIFTQDASGCGQGVVFNRHRDESLSLNTPGNSFDPERDLGLEVLFTGLGAFFDRQDGVAWTFNPLDNQIPSNRTDAWLGARDIQESQVTNTRYAGPAAGTIGIDEVDVSVFADPSIYEGCRVPLYVTDYSHSSSQFSNVSIKRGGGACVEPPPDTLAVITWRKNTIFDVASTSFSEGVDAQFRQGSRLVFPAGPTGHCCLPDPQPAASCRASLPTTIGAGTIMITGVSGSPIALPPRGEEGDVKYETALPAGSLTGGTYRIAAEGGPAIGAFEAVAEIPPPIAITAMPKPGETVTLPYRITWTGGDDRSTIAARLRIFHPSYSPFFEITLTAGAAAGSLELPSSYFQGPFGPPGTFPAGEAEIILTQQPVTPQQPADVQPLSVPAPTQPFAAPGLSKGGGQMWSYVWDVRGLKR